MNHKTYFLTSAVVFLAGAVVHMMHLVGRWDFALGSFLLPRWMSVAAIVVAGSLACAGFRFAFRNESKEREENKR